MFHARAQAAVKCAISARFDSHRRKKSRLFARMFFPRRRVLTFLLCLAALASTQAVAANATRSKPTRPTSPDNATAYKGAIIIDGQDVLDPKTDVPKIRQKMNMVFQSFNLFAHKTILENVTLAPVKVRQILLGGSKKMIVYDDMEASEKVKVYDSGVSFTDVAGVDEAKQELQKLELSISQPNPSEPQVKSGLNNIKKKEQDLQKVKQRQEEDEMALLAPDPLPRRTNAPRRDTRCCHWHCGGSRGAAWCPCTPRQPSRSSPVRRSAHRCR